MLFIFHKDPHQGATVPLETTLHLSSGCPQFPAFLPLALHLPAARRTAAPQGSRDLHGVRWPTGQAALEPRAGRNSLPILPALLPGASPSSAESTENPMIYLCPGAASAQDADGGGAIQAQGGG